MLGVSARSSYDQVIMPLSVAREYGKACQCPDARLAGIEYDRISDRHCDLVPVLTGGKFRVSLRIP